MKTKRAFTKCGTCGKANVRDFGVYHGQPMVPIPAVTAGGDWAMMRSVWDAAQDGYFACKCGRILKNWKFMKYKHRADIKCAAKCEVSKGPSCECSCGGANHGSSHL